MKRALIITYYWPPSGGSGVQRWLKFSKYLPYYDWQPVIYTPENPEHPVIDESLEKDIPEEAVVIKQKIFEPYGFFRKMVGLKKDHKIHSSEFLNYKEKNLSWKFSIWIRGNLFIPDPRVFWIRPSVKFLSEYLERNHIDVVITTGPPFSIHLIGKKLKEKKNLKWIADFRDPWSQIDYLKEMKLTGLAKRRHRKLEKDVLTSADRVTTVSPTLAYRLEKLSGRHVDVLYNGYDPEDIPDPVPVEDDKFRIIYSGTMSKFQVPVEFFRALDRLCEENETMKRDLRIEFYGSIDPAVEDKIKSFRNIGSSYHHGKYLPHKEILKRYRKASLLLLILNDTENAKLIMPAKGYEYMASGRPILLLGPDDSDIAKVLRNTGAGLIAGFNERKEIESCIEEIYDHKKAGLTDYNRRAVEKFSRKNLTGELVELIDKINKDI